MLFLALISLLIGEQSVLAFPLPLERHLQNSSLKRLWKRSDIIRRAILSPSAIYQSRQRWEGDDIRWSSRFGRFFRQSLRLRTAKQPGRTALLILNLAAFIYQTVSSVNGIRHRHPDYWPKESLTMIFDALWGSSALPGRVTMDFVHSTALSAHQPHRYLTAGFLHGGLLHFLVNMDALRRMPSWLETGLGTGLYLTTYVASTVAGNMGHSLFEPGSSFCLGASGGLTGLYGLMFVCLVRMGNHKAAWQVLRGMAFIVLFGFALTNISNAAHVGGFVGGLLVGLFCGPSYGKSYSLRRKWSLQVDNSPRDYRGVMGFGTMPSTSGWIPLPILWSITLMGIASQPILRSAPQLVLRGLLQPGSVSKLFSS
jgi:membrane associated rhomboid family serine protease